MNVEKANDWLNKNHPNLVASGYEIRAITDTLFYSANEVLNADSVRISDAPDGFTYVIARRPIRNTTIIFGDCIVLLMPEDL